VWRERKERYGWLNIGTLLDSEKGKISKEEGVGGGVHLNQGGIPEGGPLLRGQHLKRGGCGKAGGGKFDSIGGKHTFLSAKEEKKSAGGRKLPENWMGTVGRSAKAKEDAGWGETPRQGVESPPKRSLSGVGAA